MPLEIQSIHDVARVIFRRRKVAFLTGAAIFILAVAFAFLFPPKYRSTGIVQLQLPSIKQDAISTPLQNGSDPAAVWTEQANQRIQLITQRVLARDNLANIITRFNLYPGERESWSMEEVVVKMQKNLKVELDDTWTLDSASASASSAIAFSLRFDYKDPQVAQKVASELIGDLVTEHRNNMRDQAKSTSDFLGQQIAQLEASLADQENKISAFKRDNAGIGNDSLTFNMQMLATSAQTVGTLTQQLQNINIQTGNVAAQMANVDPYSKVIDVPLGYQQNLQATHILTSPRVELKALQSKLSELEGQYGPDHPDVVHVRQKIAAIEATVDPGVLGSDLHSMIVDTQTRIDIEKKTYGPNYPDVVSLQHELEKLQARQRQAKPVPSESKRNSDADNPAYMVLKYQLDSLASDKQSLEQQLASAKAEQATYQLRIDQTPDFDKKLAVLARGYDNAQIRYGDLEEKKLAADMNAQVRQNSQGELLTVVEAPDFPLKPHFPPRPIVVALGFVMSMMGGVAGSFVAESLGNAVYGTAELIRLTGLPVLVTVPQLMSSADIQRRRQARSRNVMLIILAVILLIAGVLYLLFGQDYFFPDTAIAPRSVK